MGLIAAAGTGLALASAASTASSMFGGSGGKGTNQYGAPAPPTAGSVTTPGASMTNDGANVNVTAGPGLTAYYGGVPMQLAALGGLNAQYNDQANAWQARQTGTTGAYTGAAGTNLAGYQQGLGGLYGNLTDATKMFGANYGASTVAGLGGLQIAGNNYNDLMTQGLYAPLQQAEAGRLAGLSTLKEGLAQRSMLGSSFANDDIARTDAEYRLKSGQLAASIASQDLQNRMALAAGNSGLLANYATNLYGAGKDQFSAGQGVQDKLYQSGAQTAQDIFNANSALNTGTLQNQFANLDAQGKNITSVINVLSQMANVDLSTLAAGTGVQNNMVNALTDYSKSLSADAAKITAASAQGTGQLLGQTLASANKPSSTQTASASDSSGGLDAWIKGLFNSDSGPTQLSGPGVTV